MDREPNKDQEPQEPKEDTSTGYGTAPVRRDFQPDGFRIHELRDDDK